MANAFYQPGDQRGAKVIDLFAKIAPRYDLINDLQSFGLHRYWKRRLLQLARVKAGEQALDVCCGTGDISFGLANAGGETTGIDFSDAMLKIAAAKVEGLNAKVADGSTSPVPRFVQGDAQNLPFSGASFDVVTVGYGLRNLANWERGLEEMWRVAKPGGRLLVLDFGKPDQATWRSLYFSYLRWIVPVFGKMFCGDSATHAYILESLKNYPAQRGVIAKMQELGCRNVSVLNFLGGMMSINYGEK
ncbi:MAG: ubiquinone/menaquinone biosynthesis methyltransferase [Verrucomicrobiota bacterium]